MQTNDTLSEDTMRVRQKECEGGRKREYVYDRDNHTVRERD